MRERERFRTGESCKTIEVTSVRSGRGGTGGDSEDDGPVTIR